MIRRYEVMGGDGNALVAWEYAAEAGTAGCAGTTGTTGCGGCGVPVAEAGWHDTAEEAHPRQGSRTERRPAVLMLHGLLGRASHWAATARRLAPRHRAIALDQRGHGRSAKPAGPSGPDAYAADVIAAIEQLGLAPVALIGHAMGGLTAWQVAATRPDLVAAVVICDMRASALGEAGQRDWERWLRSWPVPFATLGDVRRWFGTDDPWARPPDPVRGDFFAEVMTEADDGWRPLSCVQHLLQSRAAWIRDAHWDELAQVKCPALVVRGLDGELGRAEAQEMVRVLPQGRYAEIPDAGHLVPWDQPATWYETVESFLRAALGERRSGTPGRGAARPP